MSWVKNIIDAYRTVRTERQSSREARDIQRNQKITRGADEDSYEDRNESGWDELDSEGFFPGAIVYEDYSDSTHSRLIVNLKDQAGRILSTTGRGIQRGIKETLDATGRGHSWAVNHRGVFSLTTIAVVGLAGLTFYNLEGEIEKRASSAEGVTSRYSPVDYVVGGSPAYNTRSGVDTNGNPTRIQTLERSVQTALGRRLEGEQDSAMVMNKFLEGKAILLPGSEASRYDSRAEAEKDYIFEVNENGEPQGLGYRLKGTK